MAAEAGFEVQLSKGESVSLTDAAARGNYQAYMAIWSGRPDPDGNLGIWMRCAAPLNWTGWCSPALDAALDAGATAPDEAGRVAAYRRATGLWTAEPCLPADLPPHLVLGAEQQGVRLHAAAGRPGASHWAVLAAVAGGWGHRRLHQAIA